MTSPENELFLNPLSPCHSLPIIFQPPSSPCYRPKNGKVCPDKPSGKVYFRFNVMHVDYIIPHPEFHFRIFK